MSKEQLLSAHIDKDKDVIAITKRGCYKFNKRLRHPRSLLAKLATAKEIDTNHWTMEIEYQKS